MKSQNDRLLEAMKRGESFTPLDAWARLGVSRLSARVGELKEAGHDVADEWVRVTNQYGESCRVKRWRLAKSAA